MSDSVALSALRALAHGLAGPGSSSMRPKTVRDYVDAYQAELAALLQLVRQQSRPRRWPWQPKTIRDLIDARSAEVVAAAADWSAELAAEVAKRKDALIAAAQQQSQPRHWPWQKKTIRDRVSERSAELATMAAERGAQLAALAAERRDALLQEARRQGQPRRWPWQPKTVRDRLDERGARAACAVSRAREQVQEQAMAAAPTVQGSVGATAERLKGLAEQSREVLHQTASATNNRAQQLVTAVPDAVGAATAAAADSLNDMAQRVSTTLSAMTDSAASTVQRPINALTSGVQAGQRSVRWGRRLLRTALWAALIGFAVGLVLAPTSGAELRRRLRAIVDQLVRMLEPQFDV